MAPAEGEAPRASGTRLGVVHGHSLPAGTSLDAHVDDVVGGGGDARGPRSGATRETREQPPLFLPRHGIDLETPAHLVDHHANVRALCDAGCDRVLALGSVGSLRPDVAPGTLLCPDDFFAPGIAPSFYDDVRGHSIPGFDPDWRERVVSGWHGVGELELADGGVYAQMRGPRFESPAEVRMLASHADVVGMTIAAEAILAREAGLAYAAVCTVDNFANGLGPEPLAIEEYRAERDRLAPRVIADLERVLPALAGGRDSA